MGSVRLKNGFKVENTTKVAFSYINSRIAAPSADEFMLTFMVRRSQKERFNFLTMNNAGIRDTARALHISINAVVRTLKNSRRSV